MNHQTELGNAITTSIGIMAAENNLQLVQLLQESGNSVDASASQQELLEAAFRALKNSASFRDGLANYLSDEAIGSDANYGNYVDDIDEMFSNFSFFKKRSKVGGFLGRKFIGNQNVIAKPNKFFSNKPDAIETAIIPRGFFGMRKTRQQKEQAMLEQAMLNASKEVAKPILKYEDQQLKDSNTQESIGFAGDNNFF